MEDFAFMQTLKEIVAALESGGYDPKAQITGYLQTGDESYITRRGDARQKIALLDKEQLRRYIEKTAT